MSGVGVHPDVDVSVVVDITGLGPPWVAPTTLSVVVCAYTMARWELLDACIDSLARQTRIPDEVILVIDHSDELLERSRVHFAGRAIVVANGYARGLSGARNAGLEIATSGVIAFVDDDAAARPDWAERLLAAYGPDVAGVGGSAFPRWPAGRPPWFPAEFDWVVGCSWTGLPDERAQVRNFIGANMSLRREALVAVGGFRDGIGRVGNKPVGCEETELCIRVRQRWPGVKLFYEPTVAVDHVVAEERLHGSYFFRRCWAEGISKALVARAVGTRDGLASERAHALKVLPAGVVTALRRAGHGEISGANRALAICAGLVVTTAGYARGRVGHSELSPTGLGSTAR
jgi:GT2 family glycosyltransferase